MRLVFLEYVLAVIHDLADRRFRVRRDFYQIQTRICGALQSVCGHHDAHLATIVINYPYTRYRYLGVAPILTLFCDEQILQIKPIKAETIAP